MTRFAVGEKVKKALYLSEPFTVIESFFCASLFTANTFLYLAALFFIPNKLSHENQTLPFSIALYHTSAPPLGAGD
jgi:hypothetical protein